MKLMLIIPSLGGLKFYNYKNPLSVSVISAYTPHDIEVIYIDESKEKIPFDYKCDMVGISINTFNARRAYEIAEKFKLKGITVIGGGIHTSLMHEEVLEYCDSVVLGDVENIWGDVINDFKKGELKKVYRQNQIDSIKEYMLNQTEIIATIAIQKS